MGNCLNLSNILRISGNKEYVNYDWIFEIDTNKSKISQFSHRYYINNSAIQKNLLTWNLSSIFFTKLLTIEEPSIQKPITYQHEKKRVKETHVLHIFSKLIRNLVMTCLHANN